MNIWTWCHVFYPFCGLSAIFFFSFFNSFLFSIIVWTAEKMKLLKINAMQQTEKMEFLITRITFDIISSALQMIWSFIFPSTSLYLPLYFSCFCDTRSRYAQKLLYFFFGCFSCSMFYQKKSPLNVNVKSFNVNIWPITLFEYCAVKRKS